MQALEIKRGHWKNVDLDAVFQGSFGSYRKENGQEGTWYIATGPAIKEFKICMKDKSLALVEIVGDIRAAEADQMGAIKVKNAVLEAVTGYTAKQRAKRAQEAAKKT